MTDLPENVDSSTDIDEESMPQGQLKTAGTLTSQGKVNMLLTVTDPIYSKTCVKRPLPKRLKIGFPRPIIPEKFFMLFCRLVIYFSMNFF